MFLNFVNDSSSIFCVVWPFASDLKLSLSKLSFQDDLWRLYSLNLVIGMIMNSEKTKCIHFTGTTLITFFPDFLLERMNLQKDLGVYVAHDLKMNHKITRQLEKAWQSFSDLKSKAPSNTLPIRELQLYHSMVL